MLSVILESWVFSEDLNSQNLSIDELRELDNGYTPKTLDFILQILKKHNQEITFFVVTKLEEMYPGLVKKIQDAGHEVGWHTHGHRDICSVEILRNELEQAKEIIKKYNIVGFQAPRIRFIREGYKILKEYGFLYSSSIYGNANVDYVIDGIREMPVSVSRKRYKPSFDNLIFPSDMTMKNIFRFGLPIGSGLFIELLGWKYYERKSKNGQVMNIFIHDWQVVRPESEEYERDINFFRQPLFVFYRIKSKKIFEAILKNIKFSKVKCIYEVFNSN